MLKKILWMGYYAAKASYMWIVYAIFASYIVYLGVTTEALGARIFFLVTGFLLLSGALFFEYLKRIYGKMIAALTIDADITLAKNYREQLEKADRFHGFKHSLVLFDSLLLLDAGKYSECLAHMEANRKFFKSTVDYLFIYYHNQLHCYYFLNQKAEALEIVKKMQEIKKLKQKKYSPLFSWDEIAGIQYSLEGRNQKALHSFEEVNTANMNNREQAYLYWMMANCYKELGVTKEVGHYRKQAREAGNTLVLL